MSRKGVCEKDPLDWEKSTADGSLTTTTASSTQVNYCPTPQGVRPDIANTNISDLPRTNDQIPADDSLGNDNAKLKAEKRRWSYAESGFHKDDEEISGKDGKYPPQMQDVLPKEILEGLLDGPKPQVKELKVRGIPSFNQELHRKFNIFSRISLRSFQVIFFSFYIYNA